MEKIVLTIQLHYTTAESGDHRDVEGEFSYVVIGPDGNARQNCGVPPRGPLQVAIDKVADMALIEGEEYLDRLRGSRGMKTCVFAARARISRRKERDR